MSKCLESTLVEIQFHLPRLSLIQLDFEAKLNSNSGKSAQVQTKTNQVENLN